MQVAQFHGEPGNAVLGSVGFERLEVLDDRWEVDHERVPHRLVVGALIVVRPSSTHPLDQRPRYVRVIANRLLAQSGHVVTDLNDERLRGETRKVIGVAAVPVVPARRAPTRQSLRISVRTARSRAFIPAPRPPVWGDRCPARRPSPRRPRPRTARWRRRRTPPS